MSDVQPGRHLQSVPADEAPTLADLLRHVARGDESAFGQMYDAVVGTVFGLVRRVLRDPARAEEVTQEVFVQLWQTAHRFDPARGSARGWILTLAHRRAVDVVRHDQAARNREDTYDWSGGPAYDQVSESVAANLEQEAVRRCLQTLTALQREAVDLAYYKGYTYGEVASLLEANHATVKTRMRDGLIRLRDCLGVSA